MNRLHTIVLVAVLSAGAALVGCSSSSSSAKKRPSPSASVTALPTGTRTAATVPADAIRLISLESVADVQKLERDAGATQVERDLVLYGDLTGDGVEEAVVPMSTGGTQGIVGFVVLTPEGDSARSLLMELPTGARGGLSLQISNGKLVETQAVPAADDPECCPSMLKVTTYAWDGSVLTVESADTVPNPAGGAKGTPSGG